VVDIPKFKSTPFLIPTPPEEDTDLISWAQDLSKVLKETVQPWMDKYNRLVDLAIDHDARIVDLEQSPCFFAYMAAQQDLGTGDTGAIKLNLDSELFDTDSFFDAANKKFLPTVAGYYRISFCAYSNPSGSGAGPMYTYLTKNGSSGQYAFAQAYDTVGENYSMSGSVIVHMNGTTDYLELYARGNLSGGVHARIDGTASYTYMTGSLVRRDE
jgi:hypothetical protein